MSSVSAETPRLKLEQIDAYALVSRPQTAGRAPSFDYGRGPDQNRFISRGQTMGNAASLLLQASVYLNEKSLSHALQVWLRTKEPVIIAQLRAQKAKAFVACMTYWTWIDPAGTRGYEYEASYVIGYAASAAPADIAKVLTPEVVYGPKASPIRSGSSLAETYLIGTAKAL
jgi:hypothetical protein